jgi:serine/threonine protein kinase
VTDKYEFGKKMGDGNFAIVRRSKLRGSEREVAIKIIDKSKMKVQKNGSNFQFNSFIFFLGKRIYA